MVELEKSILQLYRRLSPEELQQEKRNATDNLQRYTERLRMLETMDDRLELLRMLRAYPSEFVHPTVKENYLNEFRARSRRPTGTCASLHWWRTSGWRLSPRPSPCPPGGACPRHCACST